MIIAIAVILLLFGAFAVAAVRVGAQAEKRMNDIFEDEKAKRN